MQVADPGKMPLAGDTEDQQDSTLRVLREKDKSELPCSTRLISIRAGFGQSGQAVVAYSSTMILPCSVAAIPRAGHEAYGA